jgi:hypothetical protein
MPYDFKSTPFNLDILVLHREQLKKMTPVTSLSILEPSSDNFEPAGLFSTEIFGLVGSPDRNHTFSYISLAVPVLHPLIYKHLITTRTLYQDVMSGTKYAVYDNKLKDLVLSNPEEGETGYTFFMSVIEKIKLSDNDSDLRKFKIFMIAKYGKPEYLLKEFLVLPAGLRDYTIGNNGRPEEDEINDKYRKLITLSNSLSNVTINKTTASSVDIIRYRIQEAVLELYTHIMGMLDGKRKFIQGKWGTRGIMYGTRNVITPSLNKVTDLDSPTNKGIEYSNVGLYQYSSAITPITMNRIHTHFISKLFNPDNNNAYLVNPKTMRTELSEIKIKDRDKWLTLDGLDSLLGTMGQEDLRNEPIMIGKKYLMLLHDTGKEITPVFNTDSMPDDFDSKYLRPITYYELIYIALLDTYPKYRALLTRYPVINLGGIYPSKISVKTTINPRKVKVMLGNIIYNATEYPNYKEAYYNSLSPHFAFLNALGADYDGVGPITW